LGRTHDTGKLTAVGADVNIWNNSKPNQLLIEQGADKTGLKNSAYAIAQTRF
jgi:hypothetical protein